MKYKILPKTTVIRRKTSFNFVEERAHKRISCRVNVCVERVLVLDTL